MARTPIIAGNWKMNNTVAAGVALVKELAPLVKDAKATVVVCPTATALAGFEAADVAKLVIAYEPIWAIGTGKTATFDQAEEVCAHIRKTIEVKYGAAAAEGVRIQYGGSVKPETIAGLMEKPNVDGALVGGAALKAKDFAAIVNF